MNIANIKLVACLLCALVSASAFAQISAVGANYTKPTKFLRGKPDKIAVYHSPVSGSLEAKHPSGEAYNFVWEKLDVESKTFSTVHTETGVVNSVYSAIGNGGLRVIANKGTLSDTFAIWLIVDTFKIVGDIKYKSSCDWLDLEAIVAPKANTPYRIYQFENHSGALYDSVINNRLKVQWTTSADIYDGLGIDESWKKWAKTSISNPAPLVDASYSVTIEDVFGKIVNKSTPVIEAIAVYPSFTVEEKDEEHWKETTGYGADENNALYKVRFKHSGSKHADKYIWNGYGNVHLEQTRNLLIWNVNTQNTNEEVYPLVPYRGEKLDGYPTGKYGVQLIVENSKTGCRDSSALTYINVAPSTFPAGSIPNAFTPNGDGQNDVFTFVKGNEPKSLKTFIINIFDRNGRKVYSYNGSYENWEGWNGKVNNKGNECKSGVYYYVVSGIGWDDESYNAQEYRSFLHLFRD